MNWSIYVLKNPRTREVRYVGWTTKTPAHRLKVHMWECLRHKTHRQRWLFSLLSIGLIPEIEVVETGTGDGWSEAERRWIAHYRGRGARLVNGTDGGEGLVGESIEKRKARGAKIAAWWAALTPDDRKARVQIAHDAVATGEGWSAMNKRNWSKRTGASRSEPSVRGNAKIPPEVRRANLSKARSAITFEIRSAARKKGWATTMAAARSAQYSFVFE